MATIKSIEEKAKRYDEALERAKTKLTNEVAADIFPELKESEDEKIRKALKEYFINSFQNNGVAAICGVHIKYILAWLEKQCEPQDKGEISDGYHTFNELYYYRMLYNAAFFNMLPKEWVHKSKKHHDGEDCFGGSWFIVMATLSTGQISNHYELKYWDLFQIPEKEVADKWDGHTPQEAGWRLHKYLLESQGEQKHKSNIVPIFKVGDIIKNKKNGDTVKVEQILSDSYCYSGWDGAATIHSDFLISDQDNWELVEQNLADKVESKFKKGDWVVFNNKHQSIYQVEKIEDGYYILRHTHGGTFRVCVLHDESLRLWTIQDAKDGDVLVASDGSIFLFKGTIDCACKHYVALTTDDVVKFNEGLEHYWETSTAVHPATKEQHDLLFQKMKEAGYEWDAEKKELKKIEQKHIAKYKVGDTIYYDSFGEVKSIVVANVVTDSTDNPMYEDKEGNAVFEKDLIEQNPAWSEEDEAIYYGVIETEQYMLDVVNGMKKFAVGNISIKEECTRELNWLKSIKGRVQPKQEWSEEDKRIIDNLVSQLCNLYARKLIKEETKDKYVDWLKSLKDRYTWNPSDGQMASITCAVRKMKESACYDSELVSLLNDLKKLKG